MKSDMDSLNRIRWKRIGIRIVTYGLIMLLGIAGLFVVKEHRQKNTYYVPKQEKDVEQGIPLQMELEELNPTDQIRIGFHHPVQVEDDKVFAYLTNYRENEVAISAFLYDEDKNLYANSGMIKPGQHLPYLTLSRELKQGTMYYINVAFYNTNDMTSEGSIWIKIGEL